MSIDRLSQRLSLKWSDGRQAPPVLPAWVAETDFALPPMVADRLCAAIREGDVGYPPRDDESPIGPAWSRYLAHSYDWQVSERQVFGIPGVVAGLYAAVGALSAPGEDVVVIPPIYKPFLDAVPEMGRRRVDVPMTMADGRYVLDLAGLEQAFTAGARLLLLCHPHNPTGTVLPRQELAALAELAAAYAVTVVSDEIHAPVAFPGTTFVPYAQVAGPEAPVLTLVSMSKAFSFAGLKCGAAIPSEPLRPAWTAYPRRLRSGVGLLGVMATEVALQEPAQDWLAGVVDVIHANLARAVQEIPRALPGARVHHPDASYLAWVDVRDTTLGPDPAGELARRGVRVSPGDEFGPAGRGFVRLNLGTSPEIAHLTLSKLKGNS